MGRHKKMTQEFVDYLVSQGFSAGTAHTYTVWAHKVIDYYTAYQAMPDEAWWHALTYKRQTITRSWNRYVTWRHATDPEKYATLEFAPEVVNVLRKRLPKDPRLALRRVFPWGEDVLKALRSISEMGGSRRPYRITMEALGDARLHSLTPWGQARDTPGLIFHTHWANSTIPNVQCQDAVDAFLVVLQGIYGGTQIELDERPLVPSAKGSTTPIGGRKLAAIYKKWQARTGWVVPSTLLVPSPGLLAGVPPMETVLAEVAEAEQRQREAMELLPNDQPMR